MIVFGLVVPKERMSSRLFLHVGKNCLLCIAIVYYLSNNECIIIKHSVFWWLLHRLLVSQCLNLFNISPGISTFQHFLAVKPSIISSLVYSYVQLSLDIYVRLYSAHLSCILCTPHNYLSSEPATQPYWPFFSPCPPDPSPIPDCTSRSTRCTPVANSKTS